MNDDLASAYMERMNRREDQWSPGAMAIREVGESSEPVMVPVGGLIERISPTDVPGPESIPKQGDESQPVTRDTDPMESLGEMGMDILRPIVENPVGRMILGGVRDGIQGGMDTISDLSSLALPGETNEAIEGMEKKELPEVPESESTPEAIGRGLTQFLTVFAMSGGMPTGMINRVVAGAAADATFDPEQGNLATFLKEMNVDNALVEYLDSEVGEDANAEERLAARGKQVLEGAGLGFAMDGLMTGFRYLKQHRGEIMKRLGEHGTPNGQPVASEK